MSDHDRGAYTPPTDAPLSFDARQPVRGHAPAPFTLIISVMVLLFLAGAIFMFYRAGVRQAGQAPQTVGAPVGDLRAPASPEAQPADPAAGLQIYRSEGGQPAEAGASQPMFVQPPEQPQARPQPAAPTVVTLPPAQPAPAPAAAPAQLRPAQPAPVAAQPVAVAPKPMPKPAPAPAPLPVKTVAPPAPKPAAPKPAPAPAAKGAAVAQIGAVGTPELADKAWNTAVALAPGLAAGKGKSVEKIDKNGGVLYRTAVTGFATRDAAQAFCAKVKAAGKDCFVR